MKLAAGAFAVAVMAAPLPAQAQEVWVEAGIDCGQWVTAPPATKTLYQTYVLGALDAWVVARDLDFWRTPTRASREAVSVWIDNWCQANPLSLLINAAAALFEFRTGVKPD